MLYDVVIRYQEFGSRITKLYNRRVDFRGNVKEAAKWAYKQETACMMEHPTASVRVTIETVDE